MHSRRQYFRFVTEIKQHELPARLNNYNSISRGSCFVINTKIWHLFSLTTTEVKHSLVVTPNRQN